MTNDKVQLFEDRPIRTAWVEDEEEWYFSIVDVVQVLTESADGRKYDLIKENIWERVKDGEYPNTHFSIFVGDDKNLLNAKKY